MNKKENRKGYFEEKRKIKGQFRQSNIQVIGISERENTESGGKKLFKKQSRRIP